MGMQNRENRNDEKKKDKTVKNDKAGKNDKATKNDKPKKSDNYKRAKTVKNEGFGKGETSDGSRKSDKYQKTDKYHKSDKYEKADHYKKAGKYEKDDQYKKVDKSEKNDKYVKPERFEKTDKFEKTGKSEKASYYGKQDQYGKTGNYKKTEKHGNAGKYQKFEKQETSDKYVKPQQTSQYQTEGKDEKKPYSKLTTCELCGGCLGQTQPYEKHLLEKGTQIQSIMQDYCKVEPIIGMKEPYHYRNKVFSVFDHEKSEPVCGVYKPEMHRVIPIGECAINSKKASAIIETIRELLKSFKIKTYDAKTGNGLLRYVLVREAKKTGEVMVVLVLSSHIMPSKNNFIKELRTIHPEIDTVLINENYKATEKLLGDKETTIFGKGFILDNLLGKIFRISSKSVYPVNVEQTEEVCKKVIEFADFSKEDIILDAYCGIGTLGIAASDYVNKVISVDSKPEAIRDAVSNSKRNQIKNIDFYTKDVAEFVMQVVESEKQKPNVVLLDTPKSGCKQECMDAIVALAPAKIVYLARKMSTLQEELSYFVSKGYQVKRAVGIDTMPWTNHVETVCLLVRKY